VDKTDKTGVSSKTISRAWSQERRLGQPFSSCVLSIPVPILTRPATGLEPPQPFHLTNQQRQTNGQYYRPFFKSSKYKPLAFESDAHEVLRHLFSCPPQSSGGHSREISMWANHIDLPPQGDRWLYVSGPPPLLPPQFCRSHLHPLCVLYWPCRCIN